jgi:hypothetical protein
MPVQFDQLPGERILIETYSADFSHANESAAALEQTLSLFDRQTKPIIFIMDISATNFSLDDVIAASSLATRQKQVFKHPNVLQTIMVTESRLVDLAARGLNSPIFGNVKVQVFKTVEEALSYARQTLATRKAV